MSRLRRIARERSRWEDVDLYLAKQSEAEEYAEVLRRVIERLEPADEILEVGCGCGLVTLPVAQRVQHVRGYDLARPMLEHARKEASRAGLENIDLREGDAYRLAEPDRSYDAVICIYLLDVVMRPAEVLREAHRLLRPGGTLLSVTDIFVGEGHLRRRARQLSQSLRGWRRGRMESSRPSSQQLRGWHEAVGFDVREDDRWLVSEPLWNEFLYCVRSDGAPTADQSGQGRS